MTGKTINSSMLCRVMYLLNECVTAWICDQSEPAFNTPKQCHLTLNQLHIPLWASCGISSYEFVSYCAYAMRALRTQCCFHAVLCRVFVLFFVCRHICLHCGHIPVVMAIESINGLPTKRWIYFLCVCVRLCGASQDASAPYRHIWHHKHSHTALIPMLLLLLNGKWRWYRCPSLPPATPWNAIRCRLGMLSLIFTCYIIIYVY